jgi:hypothetical protein
MLVLIRTVPKIEAVTGYKPHTGAIAVRHDAKPIVLDFANPIPTRWRLFGGAGQTRFKAAD